MTLKCKQIQIQIQIHRKKVLENTFQIQILFKYTSLPIVPRSPVSYFWVPGLVGVAAKNVAVGCLDDCQGGWNAVAFLVEVGGREAVGGALVNAAPVLVSGEFAQVYQVGCVSHVQ